MRSATYLLLGVLLSMTLMLSCFGPGPIETLDPVYTREDFPICKPEPTEGKIKEQNITIPLEVPLTQKEITRRVIEAAKDAGLKVQDLGVEPTQEEVDEAIKRMTNED